MKQIHLALALFALLAIPAVSKKKAPFEGRWDLTITTPQGTYPSWLEVKGGDVRLVGRVASVHTGTQKRGDGVEGKIAGVPAPLLHRKMPAKWKDPEPIFNGKDLTGWEPDDPAH